MRTSRDRRMANWIYDLPFRFYSDDSLAYLIRIIALFVVLFAAALVLYSLDAIIGYQNIVFF